MSDIRTSLPIPTEPWERARAEFISGLSDEEQGRFEGATLENIFYGASVAQQQHAKNSKAWKWHKKMKPFWDTLDDYGRAMDVFANAQSAILCPLWGSIRVVLHMAQECGKYQEELVDMFSRIGDALPRFRAYQALFPNHESLLLALSNSYLGILRFSVEVKKLFLEARHSSRPRIIACRSLWKPFRNRFDLYLSDFRKHQKEVEKHANLAHMIEEKRAREIELRNQALQERQQKASAHYQFLDRLCDLDSEGLHARLSRRRHPNSGTWIFDQPVFQSWMNTSHSDCFVCYGIPGCGKTMLSCSMIEEFRGSDRYNGLVAFHYCDYSNSSSLDTAHILRSLLKQILQLFGPQHELSEQIRERIGQDVRRHRDNELLELLLECSDAVTETFIFVDGVDELPKDDQSTILTYLRQLTQKSNSRMKVFITSRQEETTVRKLLEDYHHIMMGANNMRQDMADFVRDEVRIRLQKGHLRIEDPSLEEEVVRTLIDKGGDMFLWVQFQLDEICESMNDAAIREALSDLPKSLSETFSRILNRTWRSPGGPKKLEMASRIFRWIVCARRPMMIQELMEAVSLEKTDMSLHPERIPGDRDRFIGACGSLIIFDREDLTVTLAHHTVHQYLCSPAPIDIAYPTSLHFDEEAADIEVGEICVAYLSFSDFETQLIIRQDDIVAPVADTINLTIWNRLPLGTLIPQLLPFWTGSSGLTQKAQQTKVRFAPLQRGKPSSETLKRQYASLSYISSYWAFHTRHLDENTSCWPAFRNLAFDKQLLFEFRVWNGYTQPVHYATADFPLLEWSVDHDALSFLRLLEQRMKTYSSPLFVSWMDDIRAAFRRVSAGTPNNSLKKLVRVAWKGFLHDRTCDHCDKEDLSIPGSILAACAHDYQLLESEWGRMNVALQTDLLLGRKGIEYAYRISLKECSANRDLHCFENLVKFSDDNNIFIGFRRVVHSCITSLLEKEDVVPNQPLVNFGDADFICHLLIRMMKAMAHRTVLLLLLAGFDKDSFTHDASFLEVLIRANYYRAAIIILESKVWLQRDTYVPILEKLIDAHEGEATKMLLNYKRSLSKDSLFHRALGNEMWDLALEIFLKQKSPIVLKTRDPVPMIKCALKKIQELEETLERSKLEDLIVLLLPAFDPDFRSDMIGQLVEFLSDAVSMNLIRVVNALRAPLKPFVGSAVPRWPDNSNTLPRTIVVAAIKDHSAILEELLSWPMIWPLETVKDAIKAIPAHVDSVDPIRAAETPDCQWQLMQYMETHYHPSDLFESPSPRDCIPPPYRIPSPRFYLE